MSPASFSQSRSPWAVPMDDLLRAHGVDPERGLSQAEVKQKRKR
jgi:hypothetical protein